jgi:hypothetical protein
VSFLRGRAPVAPAVGNSHLKIDLYGWGSEVVDIGERKIGTCIKNLPFGISSTVLDRKWDLEFLEESRSILVLDADVQEVMEARPDQDPKQSQCKAQLNSLVSLSLTLSHC